MERPGIIRSGYDYPLIRSFPQNGLDYGRLLRLMLTVAKRSRMGGVREGLDEPGATDSGTGAKRMEREEDDLTDSPRHDQGTIQTE